ncbi:MAG: hypothetical protein COA60_008260 [Robiginitomaculum sp.]|nr:hypothetical protein [Robiginitomaculum sp.]
MSDFAQLELALDQPLASDSPIEAAVFLLQAGEQALENWLLAKDRQPTGELSEGFRILALHRQGAKGDPSFNACRETARELVYHYNLVRLDPEHAKTGHRLQMMQLLARHLVFFIGGKLQEAELGEFCCAAKPVRLNST